MIQLYAELLRHYRRLVAVIFAGVVGGVALFSVFFLFAMPLYTATAKVSLLPTQSELAFSQNFTRGSSFNPANLMTETHIEYLLSREIAQRSIDRLIEEFGTPEPAARSGLRAALAAGFQRVRNSIRRTYNRLNSGKHVPIDPYTDAVLTLQDQIEAEMVEGTYILELSVTWDNPDIAAAAANMLADVYVERARQQAHAAALQMEQDLTAQIAHNTGNAPEVGSQIEALRLARATGFDVLRVIDPAVPPIYPSFPRVVINVLIAIFAAIMLAIFALVSIDTFSGKVAARADLARLLNGLALPTMRHGRGQRQRPEQRRDAAEAARILRLHAPVNSAPGAVLSLGSDADAAAAAAVLGRALWPDGVPVRMQGGTLRLHESWRGDRPADRPASGAAPSPPPAGAPGPDVQAAPVTAGAAGIAGAADAGPGLISLGGASESFSLSAAPVPGWLVIVMRPGRIAEAEVQRLGEEWRQRGTGRVFGMLLGQ